MGDAVFNFKDDIMIHSSPELFRSGVVALIGPPNAGKSTLLNTIVGEKVAIVSPKPQTTRNQITGIYNSEGVQAVFLDTPGVHHSKMKLNRFLVDAAWKALGGADVVVLMLDGLRYASRPEQWRRDLAPLIKPLQNLAQPFFVVVNKLDKIGSREKMLPLLARCGAEWPGVEIFPVSAVKKTGVDTFLKRIIASLPSGPPLYDDDQLSTLPLRFMVTEIIREKLFMTMQDEIPYNLAVDIEVWEDDPAGGPIHIAAVIYVSKDNYKGMVIGKRGENLKKVGSMARPEIVELVGSKVFLELWVKVKSRWTENSPFMTGLGLGN